MADTNTVHCPGCSQLVSLDRPPRVRYEILRGATEYGRPVITITVGQAIVHECVLCADGEWR